MARRKPVRHSQASKPPMLVGIGWYEPAEWLKLKQVAADADALDDSYEEWLRGAERTEKDLQRPNLEIRRQPVKVDELIAWCKLQKKPVNGAARAEYIRLLVSQKL